MKPRDLSVSKRIPIPTSRRKFLQETVGLTADAVIVGMYQQLSDQVGENAALVREICADKTKA